MEEAIDFKDSKVPVKGNKKKIVLFSLGSLLIGTLTFLGIKYKRDKNKKEEEENDIDNQTTDPVASKKPVQNRANNNAPPRLPSGNAPAAFPVKLGAKGDQVTKLQLALMRLFGSGIFPKYGADGKFGNELASVLRAKGYHVPLSEQEYQKIIQQAEPPKKEPPRQPLVVFNAAVIAKGIYSAIIIKDFATAMVLLKSITNTVNYKAVSDKFLQYRIKGVRQTLVTVMFNAFPEKSQKESIKKAFEGMGLKYDAASGKWSA